MKPTYELNLCTSDNPFDKNITSYTNSKSNFLEDNNLINHLYIKENINIPNIDEYRYKYAKYESDLVIKFSDFLYEEEKKKMYIGEEDQIFCGRFPHLSYCGCKIPCSISLNRINPIQMSEDIFVGPIESVFKTKQLLASKVSYILNVSCTEYNRRKKYFNYLDIYINDSHTENAIKFFKITNRFIDEAVKNGKKVLIHSIQGKCRAWVFYMAYMISRYKMKFQQVKQLVEQKFPYAEPNENFLSQLKHYDLEMNNLE
jgi:protein-tyrosine phosphatase